MILRKCHLAAADAITSLESLKHFVYPKESNLNAHPYSFIDINVLTNLTYFNNLTIFLFIIWPFPAYILAAGTV